MQRRKAGDFLTGLLDKARGVDDAYSSRVRNMYTPLLDKDGKAKGLKGTAFVLGSTIGGGQPSLRKMEGVERTEGAGKVQQRIENVVVPAMEYGVPAASAVSKYVLPAAGVTLAGKGLMDLAASFGGPADQQQPGQISLGQSAGVALVSGGSVALGMEVSEASRDPLTQASISPRNRAAIAIGTGLGGGLVNAAGQAVLQ